MNHYRKSLYLGGESLSSIIVARSLIIEKLLAFPTLNIYPVHVAIMKILFVHRRME